MPTKLAKKEVIAFAHLFLALICMGIVTCLSMVVRFPQDFPIFWLQVMMCATAIIISIFAFSTWFYNSNIARTRLEVRIYTIIVQWILVVFDFIACLVCFNIFCYGTIYDGFDENIFTYQKYSMLIGCIYLGIIICILLAIFTAYLTKIALQKKRRMDRACRRSLLRRNNSNASSHSSFNDTTRYARHR
ncbi:uncharacterized protein LOC119671245 [Teleopsis dalmanni]|uniref:uncharacterized protein LOC119671234 n=1 Tax=Teleopsis dalmanni TaxID=139649 RepID=UPI000D32C523|nr:uncharacterized protein LOC119671234 [Teleopsis dalmanni]XP_037937715.1 uncharacterized protein LOC119671245 [Teleopsis dalmanni]